MPGLPPERPPLELVLATPVESIPQPGALTGGCPYEPKWDGFRVLVLVDTDKVGIWSRQGKDLTRHFPDLVAAAQEQVPPGCALDGEAVIWTEDRLDFSALQKRMTTSRTAMKELLRTRPASFVAFDLLAVAGQDIRPIPLQDRRSLLAELAADWSAPLNLSPATGDRDEARRWFGDMAAGGLEGLVIKGAGQLYRGGERQWLKVKHRTSLDVVCAAGIGRRDQPADIVVGLPLDGRLRIVGRSAPLTAAAARSLGAQLAAPAAAPGQADRRGGLRPRRLVRVLVPAPAALSAGPAGTRSC